MSQPAQSRWEHETAVRTLLAHLGTAMVATGETVHDVEEELILLGRHLGYPELQVAAAPTGITLTLSSGGVASFQSGRPGCRIRAMPTATPTAPSQTSQPG
jgi:uncharacterized membrane protein YjjP (DUF1212 family)